MGARGTDRRDPVWADLQNGRLLVRYFLSASFRYSATVACLRYPPGPLLLPIVEEPSIAHGIDRCLAFDHPGEGSRQGARTGGGVHPPGRKGPLSGMLECQEKVMDSHSTKNSALVKEYRQDHRCLEPEYMVRVHAGVMQEGKAAELYLDGGFSLSTGATQRLPESSGCSVQRPGKASWTAQDGLPALAPGGAMREFWRWQISLRRKDPLGIEVAIAFIAHQLVEWLNLDSLVVGVSMGFEGDAILDKLILAG